MVCVNSFIVVAIIHDDNRVYDNKVMIMITLNGLEIFCTCCGSFDLQFVHDELIEAYARTSMERVIRCSRCNVYFALEFVEENINEFMDDQCRIGIIMARMERNKYYRKFDPKIEIPKERVMRTEDGALNEFTN